MASPNFTKILKTLKPDLLIYDFLQPWAPFLASLQSVPAVQFLCISALINAFVFHATNNGVPAGDYEFPFLSSLHPHEYDYLKEKVINMIESSSNGIKDKDRFLQCCQRSSKIILIKTFRELEGKFMDYVSVAWKNKVVPVGPLVGDSRDEHDENAETLVEWLNTKKQASTVFVSFGTEYFLSNEEREEIAYGLELSKVNFIWVVRFPLGEKMKLEEALPEGFVDRMGERGMVVEGWAAQAKVLGDPSIGGFVSHCGWSSVMESLDCGVPIIAVPMHLDQPFNAWLVKDVGVGLEVRRNKNGSFQREEIAKVIREVVVEKSGEKIRKKAKEMSELIRKKGEEEIDEVVDELHQLCAMSNRSYPSLQ